MTWTFLKPSSNPQTELIQSGLSQPNRWVKLQLAFRYWGQIKGCWQNWLPCYWRSKLSIICDISCTLFMICYFTKVVNKLFLFFLPSSVNSLQFHLCETGSKIRRKREKKLAQFNEKCLQIVIMAALNVEIWLWPDCWDWIDKLVF